MAITSAQVSCGAAATALNPADTGPSGVRLILRNTHATDAVALGNSGVTAGNGYRLPAGIAQVVELSSGEVLFGIQGAAAPVVVDVLRIGD